MRVRLQCFIDGITYYLDVTKLSGVITSIVVLDYGPLKYSSTLLVNGNAGYHDHGI